MPSPRLLLCAAVAAASAAAPKADADENCARWAADGECAKNPQYMASNCAVACAGAGKYKSQMARECAGYADAGECSRNPAFMLSTCRAECEAWEKKHGLVIDKSGSCVEWSLLGKCESEPARMAAECNTSCTVQRRCRRSTFTGWSIGVCDKALRCEATDRRSNCEKRARAGECRSNPAQMAVDCLASCAAADVDAVLSAQRPEHRVRLSPLIDAPVSAARRSERCWLNGWAGHNHHKLMLPTECAAPRKLPWRRRGAPRRRLDFDAADAMTCPLDVRQTTPRVAWPRRTNVTLPPHTAHTVTVEHVLASPRVRLLHEFLTADEAAEILRISEPLFHRSPVRSVATDRRTSQTATLGGGLLGATNWAVRAVRARIAAFSGYDDAQLEPLQVVRYHEGELYEPHHDSFDLCDFPQKPRRHLTFLIYLNDLPLEAGGATTFPRLSLTIQPRKHMALVFNDVLDSGVDDERTEHAGTPPLRGSGAVKYAINCWIRAKAPGGGWQVLRP